METNKNSTSEQSVIVHDRYVSCDGGQGILGHPKVYLEIKADVDEVYCPYCSKHFVYKTLL